MAPQRKVNCKVHNIADGSKHLVFTIEGTEQCVGELRFVGDPQYLLVISQLFSQWAGIVRGSPEHGQIVKPVPATVRRILNGSH